MASLRFLLMLFVWNVSIRLSSAMSHPAAYHRFHRHHHLYMGTSNFQDINPVELTQNIDLLTRGHSPKLIASSVNSSLLRSENFLWGFERSWVSLKCEIDAIPKVKFQWKYRGQDITSSLTPLLDSHTQDRFILSGEDNLSILNVKVSEGTLGEYTCRAENALGAIESNFFMGRAASPSIPTFKTITVPGSGILVQVTGIHRNHTKKLHIFRRTRLQENKEELGEVLPIIGYEMQFRIMRSCDPWRNVTLHADKIFISEDDGLVPGTTYRVRLAAKTLAGRGDFCRAQSVKYPIPEDLELETTEAEQIQTVTDASIFKFNDDVDVES